MSFSFSIFSTLIVLVGFIAVPHIVGMDPSDQLKSKIAVGIWVLVVSAISLSGLTSDFSTFPPPLIFLLITMLVLVTWVIASPFGRRVIDASSIRLLIGLQGFRILPEILLDLAWRDGLAPVQMTYHGRNFDIVSALMALALAVVWPWIKTPRVVGWLFTIVASGLLFNILAVSMLSAPTPFRYFTNEPANTFVGQFPYIGLPTIQVAAAILLHGLLIRKLWSMGNGKL